MLESEMVDSDRRDVIWACSLELSRKPSFELGFDKKTFDFGNSFMLYDESINRSYIQQFNCN